VYPYYLERDSCYNLTDYADALAILDRAYRDQNRLNNARRDLFSLRQKDREFGQFFADFHRLALESKLPEEGLATVLENAISRELREQLSNIYFLPKGNYHEFANFLQEIENQRRHYRNTNSVIPSQPRGSHQTRTTVVESTRSAPPLIAALNSGPTSGEPITLDNVKGRKPLSQESASFASRTGCVFTVKSLDTALATVRTRAAVRERTNSCLKGHLAILLVVIMALTSRKTFSPCTKS